MQSCYDLTLLGPLVLLVVHIHHFKKIFLGHSTICAQCRLNLGRQSDCLLVLVTVVSQICIKVPIFMGYLSPLFLKCILLFLLFLGLLVVLDMVMDHEYPIKFPGHIVVGTPPPVCSIMSDLILNSFDSSRLNVLQVLNITLVDIFPSYIEASMACWLIVGHILLLVSIYFLQLE